MIAILGVTVLSAVFGYMAWYSIAKDCFNKDSKKGYIALVLIIGLIVRIFAAACYRGFKTDMDCFTGWADLAFNGGISQFYLSEGFHDYPPGYIYILYVLGAVKNLFSLDGPVLWVLLKLPSILADLALGCLAYRLTAKRFSKTAATVVAAFAVFNTAVIFNSTVWGQVDSVLTLFCVMTVYFLAERKYAASFFSYAAAVLIKPQAIFFAPVIAFGIIDEFFISNPFDKKKFIKTLLSGIAAIASIFVLFMPFGRTPSEGIEIIVNQYLATVGQYNYMTVNAFNLYGMLGLNWAELTPFASVLGYMLMAAVVVFAGFIFFKSKGEARYYLASFVIVFGIFMLSVKMHERYAFPGMFMLIMLIAIKPTGKNFLIYGLFSLTQFFNYAWILRAFQTEMPNYHKSPVIIIASFINVALFVWVLYTAWTERNGEYIIKKSTSEKLTPREASEPAEVTENYKGVFRLSEKLVKITAFDICAMLVISLLYSGAAFYRLGDMHAPQTETVLCNDSETAMSDLVVDFGEEKEIAHAAVFVGARNIAEERTLTLSYVKENEEYVYDEIKEGPVFAWKISDYKPLKARYAIISTNSIEKASDSTDKLYIKEICFMDSEGNLVSPVNTDDAGVKELFDEQEYLDTTKSYMANSFFDEIYHPRTAYEFIHQMSVYEWTHPPLGKVLMGIGIMIFGMVPFGWRFIGTLLGVLMVPIAYLLAKRIFKYRWLAVLSCVLFTFDFMHLTQTRLATIDTYVTLFIMLMYYYMYKYYIQSFYDTPLRKTFIPLGISGIFFGLSVASKWTGLYAGVGLAIIFFMTVYRRYREYQYALQDPKGETDGIKHKTVIASFKNNTIKTLLYCCVMFIAVPFAIYALSYIPYLNTPSGNGFMTIFENAQSMLTYHGKTVLESEHAYASNWYEWPVMYKPVWYFSNTLENGLKEGISAFGNPMVWWIGIAAAAYSLALAVIIPLKRNNYYNKNKHIFTAIYAAVFVIISVVSGIVGASNERLIRLLPCMLIYSTVFVAVFIITMLCDRKITQTDNSIPLFLLIGYFSSYMPWMLVLRTTYMYHYFPCVIFVVLMIGYSIKVIYDNAENKKAVLISAAVYGTVAVGLFILFYPVLTGQPISLEFADKYLKWLKSWVLVN